MFSSVDGAEYYPLWATPPVYCRTLYRINISFYREWFEYEPFQRSPARSKPLALSVVRSLQAGTSFPLLSLFAAFLQTCSHFEICFLVAPTRTSRHLSSHRGGSPAPSCYSNISPLYSPSPNIPLKRSPLCWVSLTSWITEFNASPLFKFQLLDVAASSADLSISSRSQLQ